MKFLFINLAKSDNFYFFFKESFLYFHIKIFDGIFSLLILHFINAYKIYLNNTQVNRIFSNENILYQIFRGKMK
jgi:hypothetical protein